MPAIPVIGSIAGAVGSALPAVGAAAGIYSTVQGINAQKNAASAAQQQANLASGAGSAQANQDAAIMAYYNSDPAFAAEYNRNRIASNGTDNRTPAQWLADGLRNNPEGLAKYQTFTSQNAGSAIPASAIGPGGTVDVNVLQQQAQAVARQNAATARDLEDQYNPGASALRQGGLAALLSSLNETPDQKALRDLVSSRMGQTTGVNVADPTLINSPRSATSPLLNDAVARAQAELALGGQLPQDVRNLVARNAFARSGAVSGGLGLGRDISARDLGLTSLDLLQRRLTNAQSLGQSALAADQYNVGLGTQVEQANAAARNAVNSQRATMGQQANQFDANYFTDQARFLNDLQNGNFARALSASQLGQSIQQPTAGLNPGSVADVAIGNVNLANGAQQQANVIRSQTGAQQAQLGGQLLGSSLPGALNYFSGLLSPKSSTAGYPT